MLRLPPELYADVSRNATQKTLLALCLACHAFYVPAASELYHTLYPQGDVYNLLFTTLASNEWIGSRVVSLNVHPRRTGLSLVTATLRNLTNLRHLCCSTLGEVCAADPSCVDAILGLKALVSIDWSFGDAFDLDAMLERLHPLKRIAWEQHSSRYLLQDSGPRLYEPLQRLTLRSCDTLEYLKFNSYPFDEFCHTFSRSVDAGGPVVFSRLTSLTLRCAASATSLCGLHFPVLCELDVWNLTNTGRIDQRDILPALQKLKLGYFYGPYFPAQDGKRSAQGQWPKRRLRHLELDLDADWQNVPQVHSDPPNVDLFLGHISWIGPLDTLSSLSVYMNTEVDRDTFFGAIRRFGPTSLRCFELWIGLKFEWGGVDTLVVRSILGQLKSLVQEGRLERLKFLRIMLRESYEQLHNEVAEIVPLLQSLRVAQVRVYGTLSTEDSFRSWHSAPPADDGSNSGVWSQWQQHEAHAWGEKPTPFFWPDNLIDANCSEIVDMLEFR